MGVSLHAEVSGASVLAAGEDVCVRVTLSASADAGSIEEVSWVSAQLHCVCSARGGLLPSPPSGDTGQGTSFVPWRGERGSVVLSTPPRVLCCDVALRPGQCQELTYQETVPVSAPPSYRGHHVKYSWKVTVGAQRGGRRAALLHLPLRVLLLPPGEGTSSPSGSEEELSPSNPFLRPPSPSPPDPPSSLLQPWQGSGSRAYNIVHGAGHVLRFTLFRSSFKLGDDIGALLDFSRAQVLCVQYSVCLQSVESTKTEEESGKEGEEAVKRAEEAVKRGEEAVKRGEEAGKRGEEAVTGWARAHEVCLGLQESSVLLPVPLHAAPAFRTDLVSLSYRLHFEFVLSLGGGEGTEGGGEGSVGGASVYGLSPGAGTGEEGGAVSWHAPPSLPIETLVWDLPVHVSPPAPSTLVPALSLPSTPAHCAV